VIASRPTGVMPRSSPVCSRRRADIDPRADDGRGGAAGPDSVR
jgi:hypothetical protein